MPEVLTLSGLADAEPDLSTFENKTGLAEDMKFLASMPELCDVTFLVGDTREPVCAVKVNLIHLQINNSKSFKTIILFLGCSRISFKSIPKDVVPSTVTATQKRSSST